MQKPVVQKITVGTTTIECENVAFVDLVGLNDRLVIFAAKNGSSLREDHVDDRLIDELRAVCAETNGRVALASLDAGRKVLKLIKPEFTI